MKDADHITPKVQNEKVQKNGSNSSRIACRETRLKAFFKTSVNS